MEACRKSIRMAPDTAVQILFTRDAEHHRSGWWKNPDYERCLHLSISYLGLAGETFVSIPHLHKDALQWCRILFGSALKFMWTEPPYTDEGKKNDVWHYRLFCNEHWVPIKPSREVYSRCKTPAGWLSYSDREYLVNKMGGVQ
jgi:hypothetical protein